ncbi:tyrosine-type recombinase/integrase [Acinetobacter sp. ANC 4805]|uniref:tyrosine-type recombinase/integrase n=1 Tax=Acinetobacter sp. ANC 4805 TaxID=2923425 RepID=UPI001F4B59CD|nr:tyrosine-type recombinase/integrase [Acinetobacter sp. ANC 4805]MCH7310610.1 tyrosine-type recombinase/integrase [Acinetobacter sp. ANC 4805]
MNHLKGIKQEHKIYEQVNRICSMCRDIYDYAKVTGRIEYNPSEGLHKFLEQGKKENMAHVDEKELPQLLRAIDNYPTPDSRIGLKLLAMLFCRPSELREATWAEFDLENALWNIPEQRMKKRREHIIHLSTQAVQLLHQLKPLSGQSEYLFVAKSNSHKPKSDAVFIMALRYLGYAGRHYSITRALMNGILKQHWHMLRMAWQAYITKPSTYKIESISCNGMPTI